MSGDRVRVSVLVGAPPAEAFSIFTEEIDRWWKHGMAYRLGKDRSVLHLEPKVGGALYEAFETKSGASKTKRTGTVLVWEPPARLVFEWRAVNFRDDERTEVEVLFEDSPSGCLVTLTHSGWTAIRPDHPARHGNGVSVFLREMSLWWGTLAGSFREHVLTRRVAATAGDRSDEEEADDERDAHRCRADEAAPRRATRAP
jgi:uncharacterized protein YndB with AHSA1/START domain